MHYVRTSVTSIHMLSFKC